MNEYECDKASDNAAEYLYIREQEAQAEARANDAVSMWHESANIRPILYTTLINR